MKPRAYVLMIGTPAYMLVVLLLALAMLYLSGFRLLDVQSDSMKPIISQGDMVLMDTRDKRAALGQVVAYRSLIDEKVLITHRLIAEHKDGMHIVTQGDALAVRDPLVPKGDVEGRVVAVLPMLGAATAPFKSIHALTALIWVPAVLIIIQEIKRAAEQIYPGKYRLNRYSRAM